MSIQEYWTKLQADPMAGWLSPVDPPCLTIDCKSRIIWCGIGGSLLPADCLVRMLGDNFQVSQWITLSSPESIHSLELRISDQVIFVSKSGHTLEVWAWIGKLMRHPHWNKISKMPIVITEPNSNPLHQLAMSKKWILVPFSSQVGGRYSAFSPVGYIPLIWLGKNATQFAESGRAVVQQMRNRQGPWFEHICNLTHKWVASYREDISEWVFLPYFGQLRFIGGWWTQLVCESLGKVALDGTSRGISAIRAVGPQDQHAQLQRWLAGPKNVGVVFLSVKSRNTVGELCIQPPESPFSFLSEHTGESIIGAQIRSTKAVLEKAGVQTYEIQIDDIDETQIGALMMGWQIIISLIAYGLEINPFDQPAIQEGKLQTINELRLKD